MQNNLKFIATSNVSSQSGLREKLCGGGIICMTKLKCLGILNETMSHPLQGHQDDSSWWRVLTECGPLEKGTANHFRSLALRTPWTVWKGKKIGNGKMSPQDQYVLNMLLGKSREIAPEGMKRLSQSRMVPSWDVPGGESRVQCYKDKRASLVAQ